MQSCAKQEKKIMYLGQVKQIFCDDFLNKFCLQKVANLRSEVIKVFY